MVHRATAQPTRGEVHAWYARVVHLLARHGDRRDDVGKLARMLDREMEHLWTFLVAEGVDPTNNWAERSLRFAVMGRKLMQGTHTRPRESGGWSASCRGERRVACGTSARFRSW